MKNSTLKIYLQIVLLLYTTHLWAQSDPGVIDFTIDSSRVVLSFEKGDFNSLGNYVGENKEVTIQGKTWKGYSYGKSYDGLTIASHKDVQGYLTSPTIKSRVGIMVTITYKHFPGELKFDDKGETFQLTSAKSPFGCFTYSTSTTFTIKTISTERIEITKIEIRPLNYITVDISDKCTDGSRYYCTFSNPGSFIATENVTVSEIGISNNQLNVQSYAAKAVVPAGRGVMISSTTYGRHYLPTSSHAGTPKMNDNCLSGSGSDGINAEVMESASPNCRYYRLTMHNGTDIGYWWGAEDGAAFNMGANKAYLAVPRSVAAKAYSLMFTDMPTAITTLPQTAVQGHSYTLGGMKTTHPRKGIFIKNGRKILLND